MRIWLTGLAVAAGCVGLSWVLLLIAARRLPPGVQRDLAAFIPDCVTTVRRLRRDPQVPRRARVAVVIAGLWVASPIDLIPEFLRSSDRSTTSSSWRWPCGTPPDRSHGPSCSRRDPVSRGCCCGCSGQPRLHGSDGSAGCRSLPNTGRLWSTTTRRSGWAAA